MTVTLQDVSMILALPIKGEPVCFSTDTEGWRATMEGLIGKEPGVPKMFAGATYSWIAQNFGQCPDGYDEDSEVVQQYARAYCWYLDEACRRGTDPKDRSKSKEANIGGPMILLSVTWEPYGTAGNIGRNITFALNPKCLDESHLWRLRGPLICYYAVEWHLPHRVMTQFGLYQETPPKFKDTSFHLHGIDKIKKKGIKNWSKEHKVHIKRFLHKIDKIEQTMLRGTPPPAPWPFDTTAFNRYLMWFRGVARTQLNPPAFQSEDILLEPNPGFDEMANLEYNKLIRTGRRTQLAPIVRFAQTELSKHVIEAGEALKYPPGEESYHALKAFAERSKSWARGVGALLGCRFTGDVVPTASSPSSSAAHGSLEDSGVGDSEEEESGDIEGEEDEGHTQDETNTSQIPDAPEPSQQQRYNFKARKQRQYSKEDILLRMRTRIKKAAKDPVIEAEDSEEEPIRRRRRVSVTKKSEAGNAKKGKGKK
ncbi:hypothetical protein ACQ4PT_008535 [Festuca glaucescens]